SSVDGTAFRTFSDFFDVQEGRMGVAVTFIAILELMKESLIEVVQSEIYAPLHVRAASSLRVVGDEDADAAPETA
ncbi:MAG: segregation/condensation protein A, partial [Pseudomonadota bacterium]